MVATRISVEAFEATCGKDRVELIDGFVVEMPPSSMGSSSRAARITYLLGAHVYPRQLGEVFSADGGFVLFPDRETVRVSDVAIVWADRLPQGDALDHFARLAPDLAVEVISPSDRARDIAAKVAMYQEAGVPLVWLVDRWAKTVTVLALRQEPVTLHEGDDLDGGAVLPGFRLAVAEIFA